MDKYQPHEIEQTWYQQWEEQGHFAPQGNGQPFSIMIPPPNVTGTLHMGHAFQHSLVDSLIRYRRMKGDKTLWQMGTDHAGIATQMIVTEQLAREGKSPSDLGREKFIERVWDWKEHSGGNITRQLRRLGASLHWETERFTLDEGLSKAVLEVFVRLHEEGLIYRGKRLVNWDPVLKTSISDLEVVSEEEKGNIWHLRYPLVDGPHDGRSHLVVATTRPETMLGDTAVAVNPDDERYKSLIGKSVELPLTGRVIPIIADHYCDPEFGSGCVKITPAHDFNDYQIGQRHHLPLINILNDDASINENAPERFHGMDRYDARKAVLAELETLDLLDKIEDHLMAVPRGEKSGVVVEPWLSDQWFVSAKPLAEPAIKAVEDGDIEFIPKNYENVYFAWMRDIQDWCISRQQWWGHRIPAWYDNQGNIYVGRSEAEVRTKHKLAENLALRQDDDVLDTWFSSALWTFSTLGWPEDTEELRTFHSTDVMITGHDIITFWVSRMIMMTLKFIGEVPFRKVYVTGLVTDANGQKMSKSKGNGLDPLDIIDGISLDDLLEKRTSNLMQSRMAKQIEKSTRKEYPEGIKAYGTDALRFTFYAISTRSRTIKFDMNRVEGYRHFCNKLWNAANFVEMNTRDTDNAYGPNHESAGELELSLADHWILGELRAAIATVNEAMDTYRFDLAAKAVYEFVWDEFCDWYLELCKPVLNDAANNPAKQRGTRHTLLTVLENTLKMAHPFLPFITEEIWHQLGDLLGTGDSSIMVQSFPEISENDNAGSIREEMKWIKEVISGTRNIRGEMDISFAKKIPILFANTNENDRARLKAHEQLLAFLVKSESLSVLDPSETAPVASAHLVGEMQVLVPMSGLIDKDAELARLSKEIERKKQDQARAENKINNPSFVAKAPADVVEKERSKLNDVISSLASLEAQYEKVATI